MHALQIVAAPRSKNGCSLLVLHPFGDGLHIQSASQIDHRAHEGTVIVGAHKLFNEGAVDLDHVDAELAQIPERGVTGSEIVDGNAGAKIPDAGNEASRIVDIMDGRGLGNFNDEPRRHMIVQPKQRFEARPPIRTHGRGGRDIEARLEIAMRGHFLDREFEHPLVEQTHEP